MNQVNNDPALRAPSWIASEEDSHRLAASRQRETGLCVFPPLPARSPAAPRYEAAVLSMEAELYSFTVIHPNPKTGQKPFALVYADFPEGARVFGRLKLAEGERPVIGARLVVVIEASPDAKSRYVFVPAREALK